MVKRRKKRTPILRVKINPRRKIKRRRRRIVRARSNPRRRFLVCASTRSKREAGYYDGKSAFYPSAVDGKKYSSVLSASRAMMKLKNKMPAQATSLWVKAA
jgi:hypothetical protein